MNQILITKKLYVTPELKKKKKMYKFDFFISVFLVCVLFSYYIYAEYDRNKNEQVSHEILSTVDFEMLSEVETNNDENSAVKVKDGVLVVTLDKQIENEIKLSELIGDVKSGTVEPIVHTTESGQQYSTVSVLNIPKLGINYPVLSESTEELLKISLCKFWGPNANEVGNYCIVGHNYKNKKFFGRLSELENGDIIELTDLTGRMIKYKVYDQYIVEPEDVSCTSQLTDGKKEVTLITCTNGGKQRRVIKTVEVK